MNDLASQSRADTERLVLAVQSVIESGQYILGASVAEFERALARYCQVGHAVGVASGTDALLLALMALGVGQGDEVITTPFTFVATSSAILRAGATPVFVDVNQDDFNLAVDQAEAAVSRRTRAILPVHLFGQMAAMDHVRRLADSAGAAVVEDAAQALGATYRGAPIGHHSDAAAISFFPTKNLGGYGDGGAVLTRDTEIARTIGVRRRHGIQGDEAETVGLNSRLDEVQAALLLAKFDRLDEMIQQRVRAAAYYDQLLAQTSVTIPARIDGSEHTYNQYTIRVPERRDQLQTHLSNNGVDSRVYYAKPLHRQPLFAHLGYLPGAFPVSEWLAGHVLSLPIFPGISAAQQEYVAEMVLAFSG
jgi:dTDP-4-amino-4,6-dideoxygalactose transaminase